MPKNHNDNIVSRFFQTAAALWSSAAEYQIFIILAAMALLAILPLFVTKMRDTANVVLNITIFCAAAVAGFLLLRLKGSQMAAFTFAAALLLRLCLVFVMETASPDIYMCNDDRIRTYRWIRHYDSVLLQADEFFYAYHAQAYKNTTIPEFINLPEFTKNAHRTSFLMSKILRFFGDEFVWLRICGAFLGAFAAAFVCLVAQEFFGKDTSAVVSLLSALAPQTAFYSVRFLKEIWIIFAVSLIAFGFTMIIRNKKLFAAILPIAAASAIFMWIRLEYGLMFIATVPIAICFRYKSNPAGKTVAVLSLILLSTITFFYQFEQLTHEAENMLDRYTTMIQEECLSKHEILDKIYKSHGPLRLLNIPLALLNPPPRKLYNVFAPENGLHDIVLQADIWQWWLGLPFLIIGTVIIIDRRTEFLAFLLAYITVIIIPTLLLGGLQPTIYRYRDSLAPIAFIIIGAGIEDFITSPKSWKNRIIIGVYAVFMLLAVYLYTKGF
jgi:energy-converting hydrogenase Eha subunit A